MARTPRRQHRRCCTTTTAAGQSASRLGTARPHEPRLQSTSTNKLIQSVHNRKYALAILTGDHFQHGRAQPPPRVRKGCDIPARMPSKYLAATRCGKGASSASNALSTDEDRDGNDTCSLRHMLSRSTEAVHKPGHARTDKQLQHSHPCTRSHVHTYIHPYTDRHTGTQAHRHTHTSEAIQSLSTRSLK